MSAWLLIPLAFPAALLVLLAIPVVVDLKICSRAPSYLEVSIKWFFGRAGFSLPTASERGASHAHAKTSGGRASRQKRQGCGRLSPHILTSRRMRLRIYRLIRDIFHGIHVSSLSLRLVMGLDDPADTGRLWALVGPISGLLRGLGRTDVRIDADFTGERFDLESSGRVSFVPLRLAYAVGKFLFSPVTLRALLRPAASTP